MFSNSVKFSRLLRPLKRGFEAINGCRFVTSDDTSAAGLCRMSSQPLAGFLGFVFLVLAITCLVEIESTSAGERKPAKKSEAVVGASERGVEKIGERIYRAGILNSGEPLESVRETGIVTRGVDAACVNCHRRSALGAEEGRSAIPPIAGAYLYQPRALEGKETELPFVKGMRGDREPYTDTTLARAILDGVDPEGRSLTYLMPHFKMGEQDIAALIAYLKSIEVRRAPGIAGTVMHFATVITADADPVKKRAMLDVLENFFADRNAKQMGAAPRMRSSNTTAYTRSMNMVHRQWMLHVWELTGPESTWGAQLDKRYAKEPVFATISGLAGKSWAPVHAFCERKSLPCIFPNVEAPPKDADRDFYTLYLNRGVELEAELIAARIRESSVAASTTPESTTADAAIATPVVAGGTERKVLQLYREGDVGESGAQTLSAALTKDDISTMVKVIARDAPAESVAAAVGGAEGVIVLWLRPADLAGLPANPAENATVFVSGLMGGLERAPLPAGWRSRARMAYGFDLPDRRRVRVDYALGWFRMKKIPVVAEQVQADTYLACGLLSETIKHMVDAFVQDYLVERVQDILEHRIVTGYYPRLAMATGQRFASKGGYVVRFAEGQNARVMPDGDWMVP